MKKLLGVVLFCVMVMNTGTAYSLEHPAPFKISKIFVSNANNYHFRIFSDSPNWHCYGGPQGEAWSYIDETDSGAIEKMNMLKLAYAMDKTVEIITAGVEHSDTMMVCHIIEVKVY
ncbi:MAG: hypothetical protein CR972_00005 [Candidatus Moraniibacteriota bacterium]|nr:MAG: hypothetical protein CR972_00005 [Candidatus Moranbacteria bacterium]